ncbi:hypothetical protein HL42_2829 [Trichophyton rubrum]|nr:hypothetical protein HL42_2829 [Trichophyton rubrum]
MSQPGAQSTSVDMKKPVTHVWLCFKLHPSSLDGTQDIKIFFHSWLCIRAGCKQALDSCIISQPASPTGEARKRVNRLSLAMRILQTIRGNGREIQSQLLEEQLVRHT